MHFPDPFSLFKRALRSLAYGVSFHVYGRTVPTWRGRVEQEIEMLVPYRRALSEEDRKQFDAMLDDVRHRRAAGVCSLLTKHGNRCSCR